MKQFYILGTGTDVGKTYVSALLCKGLANIGINTGYFKPVSSGNSLDRNGEILVHDALFVKNFAKLSQEDTSGYAFINACSPHLASTLENGDINMQNILSKIENLAKRYEILLIEGAGGVVCPIRYDEVKIMQLDIVKALNASVLLVADAGLGAINSSVLSAGFLKDNGIKIDGILLNNYDKKNKIHNDNAKMIAEISGTKILAKIARDSENLDKEELKNIFNF